METPIPPPRHPVSKNLNEKMARSPADQEKPEKEGFIARFLHRFEFGQAKRNNDWKDVKKEQAILHVETMSRKFQFDFRKQ